MKSFNYVHSLLSTTFINKKDQMHANNQIDKKLTINTEELDRTNQQRQSLLKNKPQKLKQPRNLIHFKSLPSLQTIFKKPKRSLLKRTRSQASICTTDTNMSTQTIFSLKFIATNDSIDSSDSLMSPKVQGSLLKYSIMSKKSMEFEALIEEYPTRILKASLTPSLCV
ncbi:hypothetical protein K501DRAFT_314321 [Backusella circina FSU 941]|nr:hypothetical protein K501DRAFT_314321 [Backusella circina FSU 941]